MLMFESICNTSTFYLFLSLIYFNFFYGHLILFTALMNYKWIIIMTVQGDSVSFCVFFNHCFIFLSHFCWLIPRLSQRLHKPKSPYRTERQASTSMFRLAFYLSIYYESTLYLSVMNGILSLIFVKCILIDICVRFLFHLLWNSLDMVMQEACMVFRVLDPGQVLNLTDLVGLFCFQIVLFVSILMFVRFFPLLSVGYPQVSIFHIKLKSQFDIILAQLNILCCYHFAFY
jgi:hypothetical protein